MITIKIYVLELEENKYYVGQAKNVETRLVQHLKGKLSSEWTKKYKPIKIIEIIETNYTEIPKALVEENAITIKYMKKYGWENVRGGDFCTLDIEKLRFLLSIDTDLGNELLKISNPKNYKINQDGDFFFVLKLENENYFIGTTKNIKLAILNECNGLGSEWTKIHKPIELTNVIEIKEADKEIVRNQHNKLVIYFMKKKGFHKIRGGDFYKVDSKNHKNKVLNYTDIFNSSSK